MLENIKSKYILEKIFKNLKEKCKLKIIAYNKSLQDKCSLNLNNYKKFAKRYITKESNRIKW